MVGTGCDRSVSGDSCTVRLGERPSDGLHGRRRTMDTAGKIVYEHVHTGDGILGFVEQAVGVVLNVLAFVPVVNAVAAPLAVAWDLAQSGNDFADGNCFGGVLNLASAIGVGAVGTGALAGTTGVEGGLAKGLLSDVGASAASASTFGQGVLEGVGVASGASGILNGAESGDTLGIVTGALTLVASGAAGAVTGGVFDAPAGSGAATLADATAAGNIATTISGGRRDRFDCRWSCGRLCPWECWRRVAGQPWFSGLARQRPPWTAPAPRKADTRREALAVRPWSPCSLWVPPCSRLMIGARHRRCVLTIGTNDPDHSGRPAASISSVNSRVRAASSSPRSRRLISAGLALNCSDKVRTL